MKIRKLKITNFRCFSQFEIVFDEQLTVLVGDNAAGKSSILDALAICLSPILSHLPGLSGIGFKKTDLRERPAHRPLDYPGARNPPYMRVAVEDIHGNSWDRTEKRDRSVNSRDIPPALGTRYIQTIARDIAGRQAEGREYDLPLFIHYDSKRAVLRVPQRRRNFRRGFDRFEALAHALQPSTDFKAFFEWFDALEANELRERRDRNNPTYQHPELRAVRDAIGKCMPGFANPRIIGRPLRFVVDWARDDDLHTLSLQQLSDGYRTMLALVMDIARRLAQANPHLASPLDSEALVMIDEIDLHLHPRWQQRVIPDLLRTFPNVQFIVTTHSPQVLTSIAPDQIVILEQDGEEITQTRPSSSYGAESSRLLKDILGVDPRPSNEVKETLEAYFRLIRENQGNSRAALTLRRTLEEWLRDDPALISADMEIRRRERFGR